MNASTSSLPGSPFETWCKQVMLSDMEVLVPLTATAECWTPRQWLVQGELVRFFLLIHPQQQQQQQQTKVTLENYASLGAVAQLVDSDGTDASALPGGSTNRASQLPASAASLQHDSRPETLANGAVALPLELRVDVLRRHLGKELALTVRLTASPAQQLPSDELLDTLLSPVRGPQPVTTSAAETREVRLAVRVYHALRVRTKRLGASSLLAVAVENVHPAALDVTLHDVAIHFLDRGEGSLRPLVASRAVNIAIDRSELPLLMHPRDEFEFAVRVDASPGLPGDGSSAVERMPCWASVVWSCACVRGTVAASHECPPLHVPNYREVYAAVRLLPDSGNRPVQPGEQFEAEFAVTNASSTPHSVALVVDPPRLHCPRKRSELGEIPPMGTVVVRVPFVALCQGVLSISPVSLLVDGNNASYISRERCSVFCDAHIC